MSEINERINTAEAGNGTAVPSDENKLSISYILTQIEKIAAQTEYISQVLAKLGDMSDGDAGESGSPGNILGQAKAQALGDIVRCRETTSQQLIQLYEKMYDDLKTKSKTAKERAVTLAEHVFSNSSTMEQQELLSGVLDSIRQIND